MCYNILYDSLFLIPYIGAKFAFCQNEGWEGESVRVDLGMFVDTVDQNNRIVGQTRRKDLFFEKKNFRTVHILLFTKEDEIILQLLPKNHPRSPNLLGSSVAGYLFANESYFHAARRKMVDELDTTVRIKNIGTYRMSDEGCNKFVGIYIGSLNRPVNFNKKSISDLIYMETKALEAQLDAEPSAFTETFLFVYKNYKQWIDQVS